MALGLWFKVGACYEKPNTAVWRFEHLLFKDGAPVGFAISEEIEAKAAI